jgi:hypothetical protein
MLRETAANSAPIQQSNPWLQVILLLTVDQSAMSSAVAIFIKDAS